jgi:hypothetical protein
MKFTIKFTINVLALILYISYFDDLIVIFGLQRDVFGIVISCIVFAILYESLYFFATKFFIRTSTN